MTQKTDSAPLEQYLAQVREDLVNEVAGHLPAYDKWAQEGAFIIRESVRWGFDRVIRPLLGGEDDG